ncbi:MAG: prevent-host-death family protein [Phocaeicola sp.]|uniref:prevent-host-death family protein n=1 Tax=Phocaeicola sp. TaxID=2773926 RepID=UPI003FA157E1
MIILTGKEFRAHQAKYFGVAKTGEDVIIKSRSGSFRIVPISEQDAIIPEQKIISALTASLQEVKEAIQEKRHLINVKELINELGD